MSSVNSETQHQQQQKTLSPVLSSPTSPFDNVNQNNNNFNTTGSSASASSSCCGYPHYNFGDLNIDEAIAKEFSIHIGRVTNLAHLVPQLNVTCQKFQLEQAAAAAFFEREGGNNNNNNNSAGGGNAARDNDTEKAREAHFVEGLKRAFDFCLTCAKVALTHANSAGGLPSSRGASSSPPNSVTGAVAPIPSSVSNNNNNNNSSAETPVTTADSNLDSMEKKNKNNDEDEEEGMNKPTTSTSSSSKVFQSQQEERQQHYYDQQHQHHPEFEMNQMKSFNSCEDFFGNQNSSSAGTPVHDNNNKDNSTHNNDNKFNENLIQLIAELSHYSTQVLLESFLVSRNPKVRKFIQEYASGHSVTINASSSQNNNDSSYSGDSITTEEILSSGNSQMDHQEVVDHNQNNNNNNNNTIGSGNLSLHSSSQSQKGLQFTNSSTSSCAKLPEYVQLALSTSRDVEMTWFAEGFRTVHMNLLCNSIFECPVACRSVLQCEGLVQLVLFHGNHLDPENPGLNEWSAFTMRNLSFGATEPESIEYLAEIKRRAAASSSSATSSQARSASATSSVSSSN